jgi:hypothetical protein
VQWDWVAFSANSSIRDTPQKRMYPFFVSTRTVVCIQFIVFLTEDLVTSVTLEGEKIELGTRLPLTMHIESFQLHGCSRKNQVSLLKFEDELCQMLLQGKCLEQISVWTFSNSTTCVLIQTQLVSFFWRPAIGTPAVDPVEPHPLHFAWAFLALPWICVVS